MIDPEQYLTERVKQYQDWYDKKAVITKRRYTRMRILSVVGGTLVPVLANVKVGQEISGFDFMPLIVTVISIVVVVCVSLETVFHYREQWKNYRSTEQLLSQETFRYRTRIRPYASLDDATAFRLLVSRIEAAISAENASTLNVMTLASEPASALKFTALKDEPVQKSENS